MQQARQLCGIPEDDRHMRFDQLLANDGAYRSYPLEDLKEAIGVLRYTGGTTGLPKGAMLTHANLSSACSQIATIVSGEPKVLEYDERLS
jgi:long-chain acyl-CoA synthetase